MRLNRFFFSIFLCLLSVTSPLYALRIVSLLPSNTEILESLGAGDEVVGVTRYDTLLKRRPGVGAVGDFLNPNMEKIVSLHPDLIVAGLWTSSHTVPRLKTMGYRVVEIRNPDSMKEIYESIHTLAKAVGRASAAESVIQEMTRRLEKVQERARGLPRRLKTYIEVDRPYWTIGGHDFLVEAFAMAGADNIFSDLKRQAAQVSPEIIIERHPELIVSFAAKQAEIVRRPGWSSLQAVRTGFIIDDVSEDDLSHPSPQLVVGVEALVQRIEALEKR